MTSPCPAILSRAVGFRGTSSGIHSYDKATVSGEVLSNDKDTRQIEREALPGEGGVRAAIQALKTQLPEADKA